MTTEQQETPGQRLDRELSELLQELRVVLSGVQVLLAFLLTAPFNQRISELTADLRELYFAAICCAVVAVVLLLAPPAHHRLRFREGDKERLVRFGTRLAVWGTVFLAAAIVLALYVVTEVLFNGAVALLAALVGAALFAAVWYLLPLSWRRAD